jgi:K(+)-stimulated pyrophosphate-energized sodium pump
MELVWVALAVGALAMLTVAYLAWAIVKEDTGTPQMVEFAGYIQEGVEAFIRRQYRAIAVFAGLTLIALMVFFRDVRVSAAFVLGSSLSLLAAYVGLLVAVKAGVRTANAARSSSTKAFTIAFRGGAVMGLSVVGLSLIGVSVLFMLYGDPNQIVGFGFGASLAALFAQLGGGIFTKAADVGADLVGKIEQRIPEDDPRNPAVIADQVGDNVGDCAGRGSDLFESISDDYVTAMVLSSLLFASLGTNALVFPLLLGASGVVATIIGVSVTRGWKRVRPVTSFNVGLLTAAIFSALGAYLCATMLLGDLRIFWAAVSGLAASLAVGLAVQYYTGVNSGPVRKIAEASKAGAAINLMTGLSYAFQSPFIPFLLIISSVVFSYWITGGSLYGLVAANIGTDLAIGMIMSSDTFGPIVDNAAGIAQMSHMTTMNGGALEQLDTMGNTTKAYTKAFATASGTVSSIVIFSAYGQMVKLSAVSLGLLSPVIIAGLLLGAMLPFLFSSLAIGSTAKTAYRIVDEVRRQLRENPDIIEGKARPDYVRCVDIGTKYALREMIAPGVLAVISPVVIGLLLGKYALGAMLLGGLSTASLLSPFFTFGGGMWDNAKKHIERQFWMKGTPTHAASVIGDTVGDPLKDVAGPSLNIFMKLTNMTALLIAPVLLSLELVG